MINGTDMTSSGCKEDSHKTHYWRYLGLAGSFYLYGVHKVWQCMQCKKYLAEQIPDLEKQIEKKEAKP